VSESSARRGPPWVLIAWALAAIAIVAGVTWATSTGALTWSMAVDAREGAAGFVAGYPVLAYAVYILLFVVMALLLFPAQLWIIIFGAMLFGFWPALIVSWAAAVISAVAVFVAGRTLLAERYRAASAKYLARVQQEFSKDQLIWMLAVRFIPVVPYCISNVAPAFLGARFAPFLIAAMIGVIPYVSAYSFAGAKAGEVLNRDAPPDVASLAADMFPVMLAVAALPLLALAVRRFRRKPTR
jgi:uncharacterized membrane protein YdjX (TVP38/TMEM64 family)